MLLYVSCQSGRKGADKLNAIEKTIAKNLCTKLAAKLAALYVGFIEVDAQIQYYYYIHDMKEFEQAEQMAQKTPMLHCNAGVAKEPDWLTYTNLLYPDEAKLQTEQNLATIELMKKQGDTVNAVRRVTLTLFFPTEHIMLEFAEQARIGGFAFDGPVYAPERELAYGAGIVRLSTLKKADVDALTTRAINLAKPYGGEFGEWSSPVMR